MENWVSSAHTKHDLAETIMSKLEFNTFITFRDDTKVSDANLFPAPASANANRVVLGDIPFRNGVPHPKNALSVLYGYRDVLEELKRQHERAEQHALTLVKVSFALEVEAIQGSVGVSDLSKTTFLNLSRASKELQDLIVEGVNLLAVAECDDPTLFDKGSQLGSRPDLLCDFLRTDAAFSHLDGVVYRIPDDGSVAGRQVATLFTTDVVDFTVRGDCPFDLALPLLPRKRQQRRSLATPELACA